MAASITRRNAAENRITVCCFWGLLFFPGSKPRDINSAFCYLVTYQQVRPWREGCQINHSRTLWSLKGTYYAYLLCFSTKDGKRASLEILHVVTYRPHWWIDAPEYNRPALVYISVFSCHLYCFSPSSARSFTSLCISPHRTLYCISARLKSHYSWPHLHNLQFLFTDNEMSAKYEDTNYNLACNLSPVMSQFLKLHC